MKEVLTKIAKGLEPFKNMKAIGDRFSERVPVIAEHLKSLYGDLVFVIEGRTV
jgi:hypothetical protein